MIEARTIRPMYSDDEVRTEGVHQPAPLVINCIDELAENEGLPVRTRHKARLLSRICRDPETTRKSLIAQLGLRPGTVSELIQELLAAGLVYERPPKDQNERGRPEIPLLPNWSHWVAVSVYCVSLEMRAVLVNAGDEIVGELSQRIPSSSTGEEIAGALGYLIDKVVAQQPAGSTLLGVSLSVPGLVDSTERRWVFSARWPLLRQLSLSHVQDHVGAPFHLQRQLDLQLEYAMFRDPTLRTGNTLLFHWGYGIGGAYASNGTVIRSNSGVFCQIGHISVYPRSTRPCICGRIGCLEADAAWWALAPRAAETLDMSPENELDVARIAESDAITDTEYFRHALDAVTHAISHLQAILVPDRILMYGPFLQSRTVFDSIAQGVKKHSPPFIAENTRIEVVDLASAWNPHVGTLRHFAAAYTQEITRELSRAHIAEAITGAS